MNVVQIMKYNSLGLTLIGLELMHLLVVYFRWKGENVATYEVANVLTKLGFIHDANVYGVEVPG